MKLVCVFNSINNLEVQVAKSILDEKGIISIIPNDQISSIIPQMAFAHGGVQLLVSENDYEIAKKALNDFYEGQDIDKMGHD